MARASSQSGFTLVEALAALGVFAVAAISLAHLSSETTAAANYSELRFLAQVEAENQLVNAFVDDEPLRGGVSSGLATQNGRELSWTRTVVPTERRSLFTIEVAVSDPASGQVLAKLQTLRSDGGSS